MENALTDKRVKNVSGKSAGGILHIHPSLKCNLSCSHCYSSSSPGLKNALPYRELIPLMEYSLGIGYNILSISGGEPFLYRDLLPLLETAREIGYRTQLVTNGSLINSPFAKHCLKFLDLVAVSIDGDENMHDTIRKQKGAYQKALTGIETIVDSGIALGVIHAITNNSWQKMIELTDMAYALGARLIQFHPLELSGRALIELPEGLGEEEFYKSFILFNYLQEKYEGAMRVHMDCLHRSIIESNPEICGYFGTGFIPAKENFCDIANSLIVNENGEVYPFSYGLSPQYSILNIKRKNTKELSTGFDDYFSFGVHNYNQLLRHSYTRFLKEKTVDLVVWSDYVVKQSLLKSSAENLPVA